VSSHVQDPKCKPSYVFVLPAAFSHHHGVTIPNTKTRKNPEIEQVFSVSLIVYSKVKKVLQGRATSKEEKTMKTKKLSFTVKSLNCTEFLWSMLEKHGQDDYEVTVKKYYLFRYTSPKIQGYVLIYSLHDSDPFQ
jgi:hypothetical protein